MNQKIKVELPVYRLGMLKGESSEYGDIPEQWGTAWDLVLNLTEDDWEHLKNYLFQESMDSLEYSANENPMSDFCTSILYRFVCLEKPIDGMVLNKAMIFDMALSFFDSVSELLDQCPDTDKLIVSV